MHALALAVVAPLFGLSLQLTPPELLHDAGPARIAPSQVRLLVDDAAQASGTTSRREEQLAYAEAMKERSDLIKIHKPLGIATWAAMTATVALGFIQYYNLYGFGADQASNPCVTGDAVFGQGQCSGTPWLHLTGGLLTTALYSATFAVSLGMPDPGGELDEGDSEYAQNLRMHKLLRWVHFGGMIAQMALGLVVANNWFGLDRANNYGALQALSTVHLGTGLVTWGAMTWAGIIMF